MLDFTELSQAVFVFPTLALAYCWSVYCWSVYCWSIYCWSVYC